KAENLWKSVTTVSNPGKRRGRGRGAGSKTVKDLNKGQTMGVGKVNMVWPGLNAPIVKGNEVVRRTALPEDKEYVEKLIRFRNEMDVYRKVRISPLERGWSGKSLLGRWYGPPDPVDGEPLTGFNTKLVVMKFGMTMDGNKGKVRRVRVAAITGNKKGCVGYGSAVGGDFRAVTKKAVNRAAQNLMFYDIHDGHTVTHDFFSQCEYTKVFVHKKPPGFGIVAHRAIKAVCDCIGIKDIYVKTEGANKNYENVIRAFMLGLARQKTYQQLADEKNLHLVEFRQERDYLPVVVASPSSGKVRTTSEIHPDEVMDFHMHLFDGQVRVQKSPKVPAYTRSEGYYKYLKNWHYQRSRQQVRVYLKAKYGEVISFLNIQEKEERERHRARSAQQHSSEERIASEQ
ncbi:28S ribosomal protein S5-like protein, partial [Dinothrombium tinctorium]